VTAQVPAQAADARAEAGSPPPASRESRVEPGVLPVIASDADTGVLVGVFAQAVRLEPGAFPYAWRLRGQLALSLKDGPSGLEVPLHDDYVRLDFPGVPDRASRVFFDATYARVINRGYFGLGNASRADPPELPLPEGAELGRRNRYIFDHPFVRTTWLRALWPHVQVLAEAQARAPAIRAYAGSELEEDLRQGALPRSSVSDAPRFSFATGIVFDTRDHETVPTRGLFHDVTVRGSIDAAGHGAWGATAAFRGYVTPVPRYVTFAARVLVDVVGGEPLLSELTTYGGFQPGVIGGTRGIRGVPAGRYHGRTKVLGNVEVRSFFLPFRVLGQEFDLGSAVFADTGRVWSGTLASDRALDGDGLGLRWGVGLGPRVRWGDSLLIRFDLAHSPDTSPGSFGTALYIDADAVL
jgi:hypothetical protein